MRKSTPGFYVSLDGISADAVNRIRGVTDDASPSKTIRTRTQGAR